MRTSLESQAVRAIAVSMQVLGFVCRPLYRYRPKGVFGKGVGNSQNASEMRQKCVRNASKWVLFYWEKRNVQNASEIRQNCVKNASKMRGTPLGENTFWTIPIVSCYRGATDDHRFLPGSPCPCHALRLVPLVAL